MINIKLLNSLPTELINIIISYTYTLQSKDLLEDIKHFSLTKEQLYNSYYNYWKDNWPEEYKDWLFNDILGFANNNKPIMWGYTEGLYTILSRNIRLTNNQSIEKYMLLQDQEHKNVDSLFNIFWGLFTIEEREDFINYRHKSWL